MYWLNFQETAEIATFVTFHYIPNWFILAIDEYRISYVSHLHNGSASVYNTCMKYKFTHPVQDLDV